MGRTRSAPPHSASREGPTSASAAGPSSVASLPSTPPARARASQKNKTLTPAPEDSEAPLALRYPFHEPLSGIIAKVPATRYASLSPGQCRAELKKREISTMSAYGPAKGIATPLRLSGPLGGVRFVAPGKRSVYGMLDCRLVLALEELSAILERHEVTEVHVDNFYRPRARLPGKKWKRSQHAHGLAIDILAVKLRDGRTLVVERDWHGTMATPPCGPESRVTESSDEAIRLRNLVCDIARAGVFHHMLTPNYDAAHGNHLHFDIKRDDRSVVVR